MTTATTAAPTLAQLTTLRVGGPATTVVEVSDETGLIEAVQSADESGEPVLVVGGGSNLLVSDAGFPGTVVVVRSRGITLVDCGCGYPTLEVAAGERWDDVVIRSLEESLAGIECLSGIPGSTGATPVQNVGAYGQEVGDRIERVRVWDRLERRRRTFAAGDCGFGYRTSRFKQERFGDVGVRYVVLSLDLALRPAELSDPIRYAELARVLGVAEGARAPLVEVRSAVLGLRSGKGMVLDDADADTWSAGSFFTNPIVAAEVAAGLPPQAPRWPTGDGCIKVPAAWLIQHAGFAPGHGSGAARLSSKHVLAVTNRGGASAAQIVALAAEVRDGVRSAFGILLEPEPTLVGLSL